MRKNIFFLLVLTANVLHAQIHLPSFFSDNMVLQQNSMANIWGTDRPNQTIRVSGSWGQSAKIVSDEKGNWKLQLQTPTAGGPYTIRVAGSDEKNLKNVLIGEVWFCSGQSNMQMPLKGNMNQPIIGSNEAILNSTNDQIRYFDAQRKAYITQQNDTKGEWKAAEPSTTGDFGAVAYFFAKKLNASLHIPIGIIQSAWGASSIESWMDAASLSAFPNKIIPDTVPAKEAQKFPTIMYNSMLHPFIGYNVKGMLWYQGEANRENANEYQSLFTSMISSWRTQWGIGEFPFYFVQIAPFEPGTTNSAFLREAQLETMLHVNNTGMAVTLDIGDQTVIHPSQKEPIGNRLAYWALAKNYGVKGIAFSGPVYKKSELTKDNKMLLYFDFAGQGLSSFGANLSDFEIAGEDKVFYPAQAKIVNDKPVLQVWSDAVKNPVSVRYAFKSWVKGSLYNTQGLPASSFRTDRW